MEKWFCGSSGCFWGIRVYIGKRIRSGQLRGAHEVGERALHPCGRLVALPTCNPSLLGVFLSKKNHREGFIPFGLRLVFLFYETQKQGKKQKLALGSRLIS